MIYKYSQLDISKKITYDESLSVCKNKIIHLGQLKLLFTELLFLSMHCKKGDLVIYVGAAPGYHTTVLADLFPDANFELWDPREFETEPRENIKLFQEYFTDDSARAYSKNETDRILFMCDLRNLGIGKMKRGKKSDIESMDNLVSEDMILQKRWCKIINPHMAYLKFRLPYEIEKTKYLTGTIFLQPYTKVSTESRLMTNDYETEKFYDNLEFEKVMAFHNAYNRCISKKYTKWQSIMEKYKIKNNWDNALALYTIRYYLKHIKYDKSFESVGNLFIQIVEYHIKKYGDKYEIIFEK